MRAIGLDEFGGPEVLHTVEIEAPEAGPGEVGIRVAAVAVNPTDATFRSGGRASLLADHRPPHIPGVDAAGVVDEIGADGDGRLSVGDSVVAFVVPFGPRGGSYADRIVIDQRSVVHAPHSATAFEASTLLLNAATAYLALDAIGLEPGQTVAVTGAAGAVGGYAVQLAKARGLKVIADSSPSDVELVRSFGADEVVERGDGFVDAVRKLVPSGVPGVVDGAAVAEAVLGALADGGVLAVLKGQDVTPERGITVVPIGSFASATDTALFETVRDLADDGAITLRVADVVPAGEAAEAHRRLAAGGVRGRLVLDFAE